MSRSVRFPFSLLSSQVLIRWFLKTAGNNKQLVSVCWWKPRLQRVNFAFFLFFPIAYCTKYIFSVVNCLRPYLSCNVVVILFHSHCCSLTLVNRLNKCTTYLVAFGRMNPALDPPLRIYLRISMLLYVCILHSICWRWCCDDVMVRLLWKGREGRQKGRASPIMSLLFVNMSRKALRREDIPFSRIVSKICKYFSSLCVYML